MTTEKISSGKKGKIKNILLIAGIVLGFIVGLVWEDATVLEPLGTLYINLMLCTVVPLVFFLITSTIGNMSGGKKSGKTVTITVLVFYISSLIAGLFAIAFFTVFKMPQIQVSVEPSDAEATSMTVLSLFAGLLSQSDFLSLFSVKTIVPMITAAILFGFAIQKCGGAESPAAKLFTNLYECTLKVLDLISYYMPIGLFGIFASLASRFGASIIKDYLRVIILLIAAEVLYFALAAPIYTFLAAGKTGLKIMYRHILNIIPVSFGTMSSVATAPTNIAQAKDSGIPDSISGIVVPLGANMNMNGSVIFHVGRFLFLFSFFGMPVTAKIAIILVILIASCSLVTPGVPGGSKITTSVVMTIYFGDQFGLASALVSPLGKVLDPFMTTVNAAMDYIMSFVVTRFVEGKDWLKKRESELKQ